MLIGLRFRPRLLRSLGLWFIRFSILTWVMYCSSCWVCCCVSSYVWVSVDDGRCDGS